MKSRYLIAAASITALLLTGCVMRPYRIDIQQGNVISQKQVSQLKKGMSKREVRYLLGTPLILDPFHEERWDYYYSNLGSRESEAQTRRITVVFAEDKLDRIEGDVVAKKGGKEETEEPGGTSVDKPTQKKKSALRRTWDRIWE